ncbi:MAG: hypothetical protein ACREK2_05870 [Gemmatimonadota bacterium]
MGEYTMKSLALFSSPVLLALAAYGSVSAQVFSVPVRWCVVADDANGNGRFDPGEQGAPAFTDPGHVGEVDADNVLWRRHERPSEAVFIPEAQLTFRSGIYNIVEDPILRFPIIPDPDPTPTSAPFWLYGDIYNDVAYEWNAAHNACVGAWRDEHGVEDIGVVAINANHLRSQAGESGPGVATLDGRRMLLRDNAYVLPGSPLKAFPVGDHVDKHFGHEMGHALAGLQHTCSIQNTMRSGRFDPSGDGLVDNIHLSSGIAEVTSPGADDAECTADDGTDTVNQIQAMRDAAQAAPGCKIAGTNIDCTVLSDVRTDRIRDAPLPYLDLSMFIATNEGDTIKLVHELMGPLGGRTFTEHRYVDYYAFIDQDEDATSGGRADALGVPIRFGGAELASRVRVGMGDHGFSFTPTVWRFIEGSFQEIADRGIRAYAFPLIAVSEARRAHIADQIVLEMPTAIFGPDNVSFRVQAAIVSDSMNVLDLLDEDPERPGRSFRWRSPTFPVCSVLPEAAPRLGRITVSSTGLLPNRSVHLIFGDRHIASGHAGADGSVSISTAIPTNATDGLHLVTVGTDGTALTADCTANVQGGPEPGDDDEPQGGGGYAAEYAAKVVCGIQADQQHIGLARGVYSTTINIRNASTEPTTFASELALAYPPGDQGPGEVLQMSEERLLPGHAVLTDCEDLRRRLFKGRLPAPYIEGFLVIRGRSGLDVIGVYTAADLSENVRSVDVETIPERPVPTD